MDEFDNIDDLYQNMINQFSGKPDDRSWSRLENNLDLDDIGVENWYKDKIENSNKVPHEKVWEDISMKIDTDSVWKRLAISLHRRDRIIWWWQFSASTLTLVAAIGIILFTQYPEDENLTLANNHLPENQSEVTFSKKNDLNTIVTTTGLNEEKTTKTDKNGQKLNYNPITKISVNNYESEISKSNNFDTKKNIAAYTNKPKPILEEANNDFNNQLKTVVERQNIKHTKFPTISAIPFIIKINIDNSLPNKINIPIETLPIVNTKNDYFYVGATIINPWLFNANTYNALRRNSSDYNQTLFTGGASLGYVHWLKKIGIEGNISYQEKGHNYMVYIEGKSYEKKINLDYALASIQLKKSINEKRLKPWKSYVSGGIYYGRIVNQNTIFNGAPYTSNIDYAKNDFGITLNFETQVKVKKSNIAFGLTATQGLKNIYNGTDYIKFSKTYNFTVAGSIKYLIPVKK